MKALDAKYSMSAMLFILQKGQCFKKAGENRIGKNYRMEQRPVFKLAKAPERFARTENASKHSIGNMLFEFLFGGP